MNALIPAAREGGPGPKARVRTLVFRLVGYAGFAIFIYLIIRTGPKEILRVLGRLSILEIAALMGLRFVYWLIRAVNWQALLSSSGERIRFVELFGSRITGYAVSYLTPAGNIGGEAMRVFMLDSIDRKKALATVIVDKTIEFLAGIFTIALSVLILITTFAVPQGRKITLFLMTGAVMGFLFFLTAKQKQGLFTWALDFLGKFRVRIPALEKRREKIRETDAYISEFYNRRRWLFFVLFGSYFGQAWLWATEIYLTFVFLGVSRTSFLNCFVIVTLGSFYSFIPVPGSMGVYELTYVSLFALLRIDMSASMAVILIRRVVGLVWAGLSLIPLLRKRAARATVRPTPSGPAS